MQIQTVGSLSCCVDLSSDDLLPGCPWVRPCSGARRRCMSIYTPAWPSMQHALSQILTVHQKCTIQLQLWNQPITQALDSCLSHKPWEVSLPNSLATCPCFLLFTHFYHTPPPFLTFFPIIMKLGKQWQPTSSNQSKYQNQLFKTKNQFPSLMTKKNPSLSY